MRTLIIIVLDSYVYNRQYKAKMERGLSIRPREIYIPWDCHMSERNVRPTAKPLVGRDMAVEGWMEQGGWEGSPGIR